MAAVVMRRRAGVKPSLTAVAWAIGTVSVAGFALAWILAVGNRDLLSLSADFGPDRFLVAYAVAGTVLASRRPSNPTGWLLLGIGLVVSARALTGQYALHALAGSSRPAAGVWAAWFVGWSLTLLFPGGLLTFLLLLFPNGRALSGRWWAFGLVAAGVGALYLLLTWFDPDPLDVSGLLAIPNPTRIPGWIRVARGSPVGNGAWVLAWACLVVAAASVFVRYRRSGGEERLQLKWFAYAAVVSISLLAAALPLAGVGKPGQLIFDGGVIAGIGLALPVAIGVAVLKYRLYAIDKIISRTVSYAVVTGLVVGVYLGCVALLTDVLPFRGSVGVAVAVLVAAALFNPLRRRVQAVVDRRFDRSRYDAERVVAQFSVQLREQVDLDVLGADLIGVVHQVLAPEHLALWLNDRASPAADPAAPASTTAARLGESVSPPARENSANAPVAPG
jgi:hypothetical protein